MSTTDRLIIRTGTLKGKEIPVVGELTIGRSRENIIQLDDLQVSRKHARIAERDGSLYLLDVGSGNGTYIGGKRVIEHRLEDGDIFRIGRQQLQYRADPSRKQAAAQPDDKVKPPVDSEPADTEDVSDLIPDFFKDADDDSPESMPEAEDVSDLIPDFFKDAESDSATGDAPDLSSDFFDAAEAEQADLEQADREQAESEQAESERAEPEPAESNPAQPQEVQPDPVQLDATPYEPVQVGGAASEHEELAMPEFDPEFFDLVKSEVSEIGIIPTAMSDSASDVIKKARRQMSHSESPVPKVPSSTLTSDEGLPSHIEARDAKSLYKTLFDADSLSAADTEIVGVSKRLHAVYAANQAITSERSLEKVFANIMGQIFSLVSAHNGLIMLKQETGTELDVAYVRTNDSKSAVRVSSTIINRVYDKGEAVITSNAADDSRFSAGISIVNANISSAMCVPLTHQTERLGVIYVDNRGTLNAFTDNDLEMLVAIAAPAAIAIKNAQYVRMLEQAYQDTLIALANAIELRDHYTVGHTWRVTNFAMEVAMELGWDAEKLKEVQMGGVLHDVGKIAVDNAILSKPGKLTEDEYAQMRVHPERGADLLRDIKFLHAIIPYCLCHHERCDGSGYPKGLKGEDIPIEGRLIAVADAFDAMTSTRPYRKGLPPKTAIEQLVEGKGTQFDARIVEALERCYEQGRIDSVLQDYFKNEARSFACPFCSTFIRFDETVTDGSEIECAVCHKTIRVVQGNDVFWGVLAPKIEL